jgi:hypothetical protein
MQGRDAWTRDLPWIDRDDANVERYVASTQRPRYDLAKYLRAWRNDGIVIFRQAASHSDIDLLLEDIETFHANSSSFNIPIEVRGQQFESAETTGVDFTAPGVKINHLHCFSRAAARLSLTADVVDFIGHLFDAPAAVTQSLSFWRGSEQPIHIDYPYVRQQLSLSHVVASWVALEDVHPDSGPLAYYRGGHKLDKSDFFDWGGGSIVYDENSERTPMEFAHYLWDRMKMCGIEPDVFLPKKGDVLLWHGNIPHEGTRVKDPALTRKSYVTHYTSLPMMPDWMQPTDAQRLGHGIFLNDAYCFRYPWLVDRRTLPSWR